MIPLVRRYISSISVDHPFRPDARRCSIVGVTLTAREFFAAKLAFETDPADLAAARQAGTSPVVVDTRSQAAWDQGHIPGARHIPGNELRQRARLELPDLSADIVVYCWGPGCNGSTRAALTLTELGYTRVRELIGGFEYWAREGLAIQNRHGRTRRAVDPLSAPEVTPGLGDSVDAL
jgi:rhodanese-related sulfurtransferase